MSQGRGAPLAGSVIQGCFLGGRPPLSPAPLPAAALQRKPAASGAGRSDVFLSPESRCRPAGGPGEPLPAPLRRQMESFFAASFADVRVHQGPQAAAIGALAYTQGANLFFARGQYDPGTPRGQKLLGHELAHVLQQRAGRVRNPFGSGVAVVQDRELEAEADRLGQRAALHRPAAPARLAEPARNRPPCTGRPLPPAGGLRRLPPRAVQCMRKGAPTKARSRTPGIRRFGRRHHRGDEPLQRARRPAVRSGSSRAAASMLKKRRSITCRRWSTRAS